MIFAGIAAGGTGTRMGADLPKQFLELGNKPILVYTLEKFLDCKQIDAVFIGVHKDWVAYTAELTGKYLPDSADRIFILPGGQDRNETVFRIIDAIEKKFGNQDDGILLTHDAVRPFVTQDIIEENIRLAEEYQAVGTAVKAADTIYDSVSGESITCVPDRSRLYQAQTPQTFRIGLLKELFSRLTPYQRERLTDTCSICAVKGFPVHLAQGSSLNMKITTPEDLQIARCIILSFP